MTALSVLLKMLLWGFVFQSLLFLSPQSMPAAESDPPKFRRSFATGLAYTGILLRKGLKNDFSSEFHYLIDFGDSDSGDEVTTHVFGLRGYRHFRTDRRVQYFFGLEGGYLMASSRIQKGNGYTLGSFAGLEYYITSRISLGFDLGPYYIWFKEKELGTSNSGTDFVLNSFLNFYIF